MSDLFLGFYHDVLGIGATIFKLFVWLVKLNRKILERMVRSTFGHRNWPWLSEYGVQARLKHDAVFRYARVFFRPRITGLYSLISWVCIVPDFARYYCHRTFIVLNKRKIGEILEDLVKYQVLTCSPDNPSIYRLRGAG
jgi:hypothetical protein